MSPRNICFQSVDEKLEFVLFNLRHREGNEENVDNSRKNSRQCDLLLVTGVISPEKRAVNFFYFFFK